MEMTKGWMKKNESYPTFMGWSREMMEGLDGWRRGKVGDGGRMDEEK